MNFNFPTYSNFHKFLLVDELALCKNPALIHYGKCSVIGYLSRCDQISSLTIPNVEKCYQIPDCSLNVKLTTTEFPAQLLNSTVEIFGEVRLFDSTSANFTLESSYSLIGKLRNLQLDLEAARGLPERAPSGTNDQSLHYAVKGRLQKEIDEFRLKYKPVIQVYTMRHISEAKEIIVENLNFRQLQTVRKNRLKIK